MLDRAYIDEIMQRLPEIEAKLSDPATASNMKVYKALSMEYSVLKKLEAKSDVYFGLIANIEGNRTLLSSPDTDDELKELAQVELSELEEALPAAEKALMLALLPPDPSDERNAIVEIRAGTGGDEAALFAGDLYRMFSRYASLKNWKVSIIDASPSAVGGYKELVFSIEGKGVYGLMKFEMGVHRVQRVPLTESSGRIHTSAATVAVFPEVEPEDDIVIPMEEIRVDLFCASGPGGQGVNTTYSAVRVTHLPTGLVAQSQDERSQHRNKEKALSVLKARILDQRRIEEEAKMGAARRLQIGSGDRSERIRTYNFPQNRLTDHRINLTLYSLDRIMEGELAELTEALRDHDAELRLRDLGQKDDE